MKVTVFFSYADINECHTQNSSLRHDCDLVSTNCVNTAGSYSCQCKEGFTSIVGNKRRCEGGYTHITVWVGP